MKTNYNILYKAIREVFIKKWKFLWHLMAANEKLNFTSFPEKPCFLSKISLFSDQKVPPNLRKLRYFPVDYYSSLNAPFLKKTVQSMYWSEAITHFRGRARLAPAQFICSSYAVHMLRKRNIYFRLKIHIQFT